MNSDALPARVMVPGESFLDARRWQARALFDLLFGRGRFEFRAATASLLRRWLLAFGPGTLTDVRWWTGRTARQTKAAIAALDVAEVDLGGGATGYVLTDDTAAVTRPSPGSPSCRASTRRSWGGRSATGT